MEDFIMADVIEELEKRGYIEQFTQKKVQDFIQEQIQQQIAYISDILQL